MSKHTNPDQWEQLRQVMQQLLARQMTEYRRIVISQDEIQNLKTARFIDFCQDSHDGREPLVVFDGYDFDEREVWHVPEVRRFVHCALLEYPQLIARFDLVQRRLFRSCVLDISDRFGKQNCPLLMDRWVAFARLAGINPSE